MKKIQLIMLLPFLTIIDLKYIIMGNLLSLIKINHLPIYYLNFFNLSNEGNYQVLRRSRYWKKKE